MQLLSVLQLPEVARIDGDAPRTHCIIPALQVRELIHKSLKPMAAHRPPVGSLRVQHSLQPYQSSACLRLGKYILAILTMSIGRLDQKCRLLQRQKNVLCIYEYYVWALNYYSSWTGIIIGTVMHHLSQNSDFARNCSHCHAGSQKLFPIAQLIVWCQIWLYRLTIVCRFKEILLILALTMIHGVAHHSDYAFDTLILVLCWNRKGSRENLNGLHEARQWF